MVLACLGSMRNIKACVTKTRFSLYIGTNYSRIHEAPFLADLCWILTCTAVFGRGQLHILYRFDLTLRIAFHVSHLFIRIVFICLCFLSNLFTFMCAVSHGKSQQCPTPNFAASPGPRSQSAHTFMAEVGDQSDPHTGSWKPILPVMQGMVHTDATHSSQTGRMQECPLSQAAFIPQLQPAWLYRTGCVNVGLTHRLLQRRKLNQLIYIYVYNSIINKYIYIYMCTYITPFCSRKLEDWSELYWLPAVDDWCCF